ncbi:MAG: HhH-GPD-type base excision DNA repair protein [Candidatus Dormibacteria bacterium]
MGIPSNPLEWTDNTEANILITESPIALLIGYTLDQQIPIERAFLGPLTLKKRLGHLDPVQIADMPVMELASCMAEKPAIHRFPAAMAHRIHDLCTALVPYGSAVEELWTTAPTAKDLISRLRALPGFGEMKVGSLYATLALQFHIHPDGWEEELPDHPTLGIVATRAERIAYRDAKRAWKASQKDGK